MSDLALFWTFAGIGLLAIASHWLAWWLRLPSIVLLLLAGIVAGPVTGWLDPDQLFGHLLRPFISFAVAIVLFEGSLSLRFAELGELTRAVRNLTTVGLILEGLVIAAGVYWLVGFGWDLALLFGAIMAVTGPTVLLPLLRSVQPSRNVAEVLRWEAIVADPIGALLAVVVYQFVRSGYSLTFATTVETFLTTLFWGTVVGLISGYLFGVALRRRQLPTYLEEVVALLLVIVVYTIANTLEREAGILAVTVMGLTLANMPRVPLREILNFKESLSALLIALLFILLAARIDFAVFEKLEPWRFLATFLLVQFLSRPLKVLLATLGSPLSARERTLIALIGPRGLVAASLISLFALRLEQLGYAKADLLVPLAFAVVIGTVLFSMVARPLARWFGLTQGGFLFFGANGVARAIARPLKELGVPVLLSDPSWEEVAQARREGFAAYFGSLLSERAEEEVDPLRFQGILLLSPYAEQNTLIVFKFHNDLGGENLYHLLSERARPIDPKMLALSRHLFGEGITYELLSDWLERGGEIRAVPLTRELSFREFLRRHGDRVLVLGARKPNGELLWASAETPLRPRRNWTLLVLFKP